MQQSDFGIYLKDLRKKKGIKQIALSRKTGIDNAEISRYESGKQPTPKHLQEIIHGLLDLGVEQADLEKLQALANVKIEQSWGTAEPVHPKIFYLNQMLATVDPEMCDQILSDFMSIFKFHQNLKDGRALIHERKWKNALDEKLLENRAENIRLQVLNAHSSEAEGLAFYGQGNYDEALASDFQSLTNWMQFLGIARNAKEKHECLEHIGRLQIHIGDIYRRKSIWNGAEAYYQKARDAYSKMDDENVKDHAVADCGRKLAGVYNYLGKPKKALAVLEESEALHTRLDDKMGIYKDREHKAWSFRLLGRWDDALKLSAEALAGISSLGKDKWAIMKANIYAGDSYQRVGRYQYAVNRYLDALKIYETEMEDQSRETNLQVGWIYLGLGQIYMRDPGRRFEAEDNLKKSLSLHISLNEYYWEGINQNELGRLMIEMGRYDRAREYLEKARIRFKDLGIPYHHLGVLVNLAELSFKDKKYGGTDLQDEQNNEIEAICREAEDIYKAVKKEECDEKNTEEDDGEDEILSIHRANLYFFLAKHDYEQKKEDDAIRKYCKALRLALNYNEYVFQAIMDRILSEIDRVRRFNQEGANTLLQKIPGSFFETYKARENEGRSYNHLSREFSKRLDDPRRTSFDSQINFQE